MRQSKSTNSFYKFGDHSCHIFAWAFAHILLAKSEGKLGGRRIPSIGTAKTRYPRRSAMLSRWRVNTDRFSGRENSASCSADKEVNAYERGERRCAPGASPPVQVEESHVLEARGFAPGSSVWTRAGPERAFYLASPRLVPSRFTAPCRAGRPWSLRTLGPTTPRDASSPSLFLSSLPVGAAAQHPLISLAGLLLESSSALILLGPPSLSDSLSGSSLLLVSTPRPERSLDSILMECLRGR